MIEAEATVPDRTMSDRTMSDRTMSDRTKPDLTMSDRTMSDRTVPDRTMSERTAEMRGRTMSDRTAEMGGRTMSDRTSPDRTETMSGRTVSDRTDRAVSGVSKLDTPERADLMAERTGRTDRAVSGMSKLDAPDRADLARTAPGVRAADRAVSDVPRRDVPSSPNSTRTVPSVRAADLAPDSAAVRDAMKDLDEEARRVFAKAGTLREGMEALRKSPTARMARKALGPVGAVLGAGAIAKAYQSVKGGAPVSDLLVEVVPFFEAVQSQRGPNIDSPEALERIRQQQRVAALAEDPRGAGDLSFQNTDLTFESSPDSGIVPTGTPVKKTTTGQRPSAFPMPRRLNVLVRGAKGGAVETLNNDLQMLGFSKGTLAGPANEFTEQTRQAVMRLQRDADITVDGKVGPQTRAAIADMLTDPDRMSAKDSLRVDAGGDLRARLETRKQKEEPTESRSAALDILEATVK